MGASVGVSESVPLPWWYYDLAHVIKTIPDEPGTFNSPRVGKRGVYFDMDEAKEMADLIGPLPVHYQRLRRWVARAVENKQKLRTELLPFISAFEAEVKV